MAEIDGGALSFKSVMDNDQVNAAIDETLRRVQGLSDGTVAGGKAMDTAFNSTADNIRKALGDIGAAIGAHEQELQRLESEYEDLGQKASKAFMAGRDDEYRAITQQQNAVKGEITVRKQLVKELQEQSDKLEEAAGKMEETRRKAEENANAQVSMRTRIKELKEEMMLLIDQGIDEQSEAYKRLEAELGRLTDIQSDVAQQGRMLANDEAKFQGIITGLSGLAGGFSAVTGAMSLFGSENEDLQKVMTRVQSVMAITIGMQQVAQALNKDSAFQLVTLNGLKEWWAGIVAKATVAETAETAATTANTAAQAANAQATGAATASQATNTVATGGQAAAATAGTVANIGLAGAFRLVGAAIKSIPVFGWILAGISALVGLFSIFSSKAREAKKDQEEFNKALVEGVYKPIGSIENLTAKWNKLGDDLEAKKRFVEENKKAFDELGVSVNDVADAENLLIKYKDKFIEAQIEKAKAVIYAQQATEKIKKQMELEAQIAKMSDTKTRYVSGGMYGGSYSYEVENKAKNRKKKELEELKTEIEAGFKNAADAEKKGYDILEEAGIEGSGKITEGTVAWYEKQISDKQAYIKTLSVLDAQGIENAKKEIEEWQKLIEKAIGKPTTSGSGSANKDPFLEKLEKYRKEYARFNKWINSGDETLVKAANSEFQSLLKEGATYIDYLKKQRDIILSVDIANRTKAQNRQLRTLNDQIAEETKKTVLQAFNEELSDQLNNAKTTLEMLNIIAQKRKELANDGTELDNNKKETLDDAEKDLIKKQQQETDQLLEDYASYLDRKIQLETNYNNDLSLLEKRRLEATTDADRSKIDQAIANRKKQYEKDNKSSGDAEYDELLKSYANFEQRKQSIIDDYEEKRRIAAEHGNQQLIDELNKAQAKALSSLALDEMQINPDWEKMFGNLDEISTKKLEEILAMIEGQTEFLGIEFDPKDLETIKAKIDQIKNEIQERNPFKALIQGIKDYSKAADDESKKKALTNMFSSAAQSIDLVSGSLNAVVGGMEKMGIQMDESTQQVMNGIMGILDGAGQLAQGIATGNPLSIIQGSISVISNGIDLIFGGHDRKAEKEIKKHAEAIGKLEQAYQQLSWEIDKALGGAVYQNQKAAIANMEEQRRRLLEMQRNERDKKKTDNGKIKEWQAQYEELGRQIEDMIDAISNDILQTDAKTFANELGDALVGAFAKGEDAADAFGKTVDNVIKQAVLNQLKKNFLENQLQDALDGLKNSMGYWNGNEFVFDGLTDAEIAAFKNQVSGITNQFNQAMNAYADIFKDIAEPEDPDTSLTGAVKGVTEETASLVAGQMNAIRINQMEATAILRQQLMVLNAIAQNTSYNFHLEKLERIVALLEGGQSDPLRSQGLS